MPFSKNTSILAYVGGSITTLMINYAYDLSANQLLNSYNIGIEIMQGISGSLGVVLTVPITAFLASILVTHKRPRS
ncbi:MAG: YibE/F family protein [Lachnospiraceae bacterium]|nr:YibE/F family protein [Lachnospiraceae bacterium]